MIWGLQPARGNTEGERDVRPSTHSPSPSPSETSSLPAFVHKTEKVMMVFLPLFKKTTESKQTEKGNSPPVALPEIKGRDSPSHALRHPSTGTGFRRGRESTPHENPKLQHPPPLSPDLNLAWPLESLARPSPPFPKSQILMLLQVPSGLRGNKKMQVPEIKTAPKMHTSPPKRTP